LFTIVLYVSNLPVRVNYFAWSILGGWGLIIFD
jgi:hypothetical protein